MRSIRTLYFKRKFCYGLFTAGGDFVPEKPYRPLIDVEKRLKLFEIEQFIYAERLRRQIKSLLLETPVMITAMWILNVFRMFSSTMGGESRCNDYALELFQCGTVFPTSDPRPPCTLVDQTTPLTAVSSRHARGCYPAGYYEFRNIIISGDVFLRYWILSREDRSRNSSASASMRPPTSMKIEQISRGFAKCCI